MLALGSDSWDTNVILFLLCHKYLKTTAKFHADATKQVGKAQLGMNLPFCVEYSSDGSHIFTHLLNIALFFTNWFYSDTDNVSEAHIMHHNASKASLPKKQYSVSNANDYWYLICNSMI